MNALDISIEDVTVADMPQLNEIIRLSFPYFRLFAQHSVSDLSEPVLICKVNGEIAGFAKLVEFTEGKVGFGCILWIAVHPNYRRHGIALKLTEAGVEQLKRLGAQLVFASTQRRNRGAQATLRRAGFRQIGFGGLRQLFGWRVFSFYGDIWLAPGEIVFMHN